MAADGSDGGAGEKILWAKPETKLPIHDWYIKGEEIEPHTWSIRGGKDG